MFHGDYRRKRHLGVFFWTQYMILQYNW